MELDDVQRQRVVDNQRLVGMVVKRFKPPPDEFEDYLQVGYIGLCKASARFDPDLGFKFSTYAVPMITGEIKRYRRDYTPITISRGTKDDIYQILKYQEEHGDDCNIEEMLKHLNMSNDRYIEARGAISNKIVMSLDQPLDDGEGDKKSSTLVIDTIQDNSFDEVFDTVNRDLLIAIEEEVIKTLIPKQAMIYDEYFWASMFEDKVTQEYLAQKYGCSQVQVSRLVKKVNKLILDKYRKY